MRSYRPLICILGLLLMLAAFAPADGQEKGKSKPAVHGKGYIPLTPAKRAFYQAVSKAKHGNRIAMMAKNATLPASFDCRVRFPLPVWDQGQCGSCFLVSTVRTATCTLGVAGYGKADNSFKLSAQFGMDSPRSFGGCSGGNGTEVIDWMIKNGWVAEVYTDSAGVVHNDYPPYEASEGRDRTKPGAKLWMKDATWGFVSAGDGTATTLELKTALVNFGRLNISLDAGALTGTGTITSLGTSVDHEINLVAYDDAHDNGDGSKGGFLFENQWGNWGTAGCQWCSYGAAANLVDVFFVSATPLPPPPNLVPPYFITETASGANQGLIAGYPDVATASAAAQGYADKLQLAMLVKDSAGVLTATITPAVVPVVCPPGFHDDGQGNCVPDVVPPPQPTPCTPTWHLFRRGHDSHWYCDSQGSRIGLFGRRSGCR